MAGDQPLSRIGDLCKLIEPRMNEIYAEFLQPDATIVSLRDECKELLRKHGLLVVERLVAKYIGVHPKNRYGDMMIPADVLALITNILGQGFSKKALLDPTVFQVPPPSHPRHLNVVETNDKLVEGSGGLLPPFGGELRHVTVTCGHTTQGLRCFLEAGGHEDERLTHDGKLSLDRLKQLDANYYTACTEGLDYDVIHYEVEDFYPWLPKLFQESGNAGQQIARCETRLEVCLKIRDIAARLNALYGTTENWWPRVAQEASRAGGAFLDEIHGLVVFVKELCGGLENPVLLNELRDFVRACKCVRVVRGPFLQAVAVLVVGTEGAAPLFRLAVVKAMFSCSDKFARGEHQALYKTSDIASFANKKEKVAMILDAELFLRKCRAFVENHDVDGTFKSHLLGLADILIAHHVTNKQDPSRGVFPSFAHIGCQLALELATSLQKPVESPCTVEPTKNDASQTQAQPRAAEVKPFVKVFD